MAQVWEAAVADAVSGGIVKKKIEVGSRDAPGITSYSTSVLVLAVTFEKFSAVFLILA